MDPTAADILCSTLTFEEEAEAVSDLYELKNYKKNAMAIKKYLRKPVFESVKPVTELKLRNHKFENYKNARTFVKF